MIEAPFIKLEKLLLASPKKAEKAEKTKKKMQQLDETMSKFTQDEFKSDETE